LPVDPDEGLTPENVLVMVAKEMGYEVEYGFRKKQYIVKRRATDYPNGSSIKTLYCSARTNGDRISFTGAIERNYKVALCEPDFFDKLKQILDDPAFLMTSTKDFSTPICDDPSI